MVELVRFVAFKEILKVFFPDSVDSADFDAFQFFVFNELQHCQVMELQVIRDLFRCEKPHFFAWFYLALLYFSLFIFILQMFSSVFIN